MHLKYIIYLEKLLQNFQIYLDFKSSLIPTKVDPKFMDKLSKIEYKISKSLNNLDLNYFCDFLRIF